MLKLEICYWLLQTTHLHNRTSILAIENNKGYTKQDI